MEIFFRRVAFSTASLEEWANFQFKPFLRMRSGHRTNGPTDRRTETPLHKDARAHIKYFFDRFHCATVANVSRVLADLRRTDGRTDGLTDGRTNPHVEMLRRI